MCTLAREHIHKAYNLENFNGIDRHHFNAIVPAQDLADTYLPPFQAGVAIGKASGLMCSCACVRSATPQAYT